MGSLGFTLVMQLFSEPEQEDADCGGSEPGQYRDVFGPQGLCDDLNALR
jgi:hypothetical protein